MQQPKYIIANTKAFNDYKRLYKIELDLQDDNALSLNSNISLIST